MNIHSATGIVSSGIGFINKHKYLLPISIIITILPLIPIIPLLPALILAARTGSLDSYATLPGFIGLGTVTMVWVLLLTLFNPIISELVYYSIHNQNITLKEAFKKSIAKWLPLLGLYLVIFVTYTVVNMLLGTGLVALLRIAFLSPLFSLAIPIILFSKETVFSSLKLACRMGWSKLGTVLKLYLLLMLITCIGVLAVMGILLFVAFGFVGLGIISATSDPLSPGMIVCGLIAGGLLLAYIVWCQILYITIPTIFYASYNQLETRYKKL